MRATAGEFLCLHPRELSLGTMPDPRLTQFVSGGGDVNEGELKGNGSLPRGAN